MRIKFDRKELMSMLYSVHPVVPERSSIPVYSNVLVEAKAGRVYITGQDTEMAVTAIGDAAVEKDGETTMPGRRFYDIVRELPEGEVKVESGETAVSIKSGKGNYKLQSIPRDEYPAIISVKEGIKFILDGELLRRIIDLTVFAVSKETYSPAPQGVLLDVKKDYLRMVATDGHRLAFVEKKGEFNLDQSAIISEKAARFASRLAGNVEIRIEEQTIGFYTENTVFASRLVEGEFPDYEGVIPQDNTRIVFINKAEFASALKRANVMSDPLTRMVKLRISPDKVSVRAVSEVGESNEELDCKYDGEEFDVGYNITYLLEILSRVETENVKLLLKDGVHAGIFLPEKQAEGEEIIYLLMPVVL